MTANARIKDLMTDYYDRALHAHEKGELVGWVTSVFPQEIVQAMDLCVVYPENHSAMLAIKGEDRKCCMEAEAEGFSNDICSYAKVNMGYINKSDEVSLKIPLPDYLLCCTNTCHQLMKWYQSLSKKYSIPMVLIDIPYNTEYDTGEDRILYIRTQFYEAIDKLEKITGKKFDEEKFSKVMKISSQVGTTWNKIADLLVQEDLPYRGTDLFNYMGLVVCQRGKETTLQALECLYEEIKNKPAYSLKEDKKPFRILYEGLCCWPAMTKMALSFLRQNMNMVGAIYTNAYGIEYNDFDDMLRAYTYVPNAVCIERAIDMRKNELEKKKCDGMLIHMSRTCKIWSGIMYELKHQLEEFMDIPIVTFDGDQADSQCFSEAQYDTRLQGFRELMEET